MRTTTQVLFVLIFTSILCCSCNVSTNKASPKFKNTTSIPISFDGEEYVVTEIEGFRNPFDAIRIAPEAILVSEFELRKVLMFDHSLNFIKWTDLGGNEQLPNGWREANSYTADLTGSNSLGSPHSITFDKRNPNFFYLTLWKNGTSIANVITQHDVNSGTSVTSFGIIKDDFFSNGFTSEKKQLSGKSYFQGLVFSSFDRHGNLFISDFSSSAIFKFDKNFKFIGWTGAKKDGSLSNGWITSGQPGQSTAPGGLNHPHNLAIDSQDNVYVANTQNHRIEKYDFRGKFVGWLGFGANTNSTEIWTTTGTALPTQAQGGFYDPIAIQIDEQDNLFVLEYSAGRVQKFNSKGKYLDSITGFKLPYGLNITSDEIIVSDTGNKRIVFYKKAKLK